MPEIATKVITYFANDPMKLLYLLGGSGGVSYWYEKWSSKIKIKVKIKNQEYSPTDTSIKFEFDAVNLGEKSTSLSDELSITFYDNNGKIHTQEIPISGNDLLLPPHTTKSFIAKGAVSPTLLFSGMRKYVFKPNKGKPFKIFTTEVDLKSKTSSTKWHLRKVWLKRI
jgi:hypothetical protein